MWEDIASSGAQVASLISEKVAEMAVNVTESVMSYNMTEDYDDPPRIFKSYQDYPSEFLPGPVQISLLLLCASAILLVASKCSNFVLNVL
jgi:hypothetical protein